MNDSPVDELAVARALRRLDAITARHPELLGKKTEDNMQSLLETITVEDRMAKSHRTTKRDAEAFEVLVTFRFPASLVRRLDEQAKRMNAVFKDMGLRLKVSRAEAARFLLLHALGEIDLGKGPDISKPGRRR